jgi:hypothetical protein
MVHACNQSDTLEWQPYLRVRALVGQEEHLVRVEQQRADVRVRVLVVVVRHLAEHLRARDATVIIFLVFQPSVPVCLPMESKRK